MKITKIFAYIAVMLAAVGCYEKHELVDPRPVMNDDSFETQFPEAKYITIAELKGMYNDEFGTISNNGVNSGWTNTKYLLIEDDLYIKGKVISDDDQGNIYKSLHIQDHTAGIELKLNTNVGLRYKYGSWVYVRLSGLYLGNYRMMLSLGAAPSESYNKAGEHKFYANSNIELQDVIDRYVFAGEQDVINVGSFEEWKADPKSVDVITVTPDNYLDVLATNRIKLDNGMGGEREMIQREIMFGRLIRFEGLQCRYAGVANQDGVTRPAMKSGSFENLYPSWLYSDPRPTVSKGWYRWAFKEAVTGRSLYGSVLFVYDNDADVCSANGIYSLRTSGYSRFARNSVCKDGEKANITAIYGIYAQRSDYAGNANDYASYQLTISRFSDMEFENGNDAFLTEEQVEALTTDDMEYVPWIDEEGEVDM